MCSLLLASTLLAGCHSTGVSSATGSAAAMAAAPSATASSSTASSSTSSASSPSSTPTATSKTADVSWTPPTTNTNGSALTDLAGYTIYYGMSSSALSQSVNVPNAGATDYVVQGLSPGTWYFAVTSYTNTGLQSSLSSVVSKTIT